MTKPFDATLAGYEVPRALLTPLLQALRLGNTMLDTMFYDTGVLAAALMRRGDAVVTADAAGDGAQRLPGKPFLPLDLGAQSNPEGCLLLVDPTTAPYVTSVARVDDFITLAASKGGDLAITITGVGSSALGSAAFAWNVAVALGHPVVAIVPGYGVADALAQGLGGWFGFGLHGWVASRMQDVLAEVAPGAARVGHAMLASVPGQLTSLHGAPKYERGSVASDVLHALLHEVDGIRTLVGHSKGALAIENALRSLGPARTRDLSVVTLGCPIDEGVPAARYVQILGAFDLLGGLNAWGHHANVSLPASHTTNTMVPLAMPVAALVAAARAGTLTAMPTSGGSPPSVGGRTRDAMPLLAGTVAAD